MQAPRRGRLGHSVENTPATRYWQIFSSNGLLACMAEWSFLTNHARALLFIAQNSEARLRDLASALDVTERTAYGVVVDLTEAGYLVKEKDGRRNRYHIQDHLPLRDSIGRERTIGELLDLLVQVRRRTRRRSTGS